MCSIGTVLCWKACKKQRRQILRVGPLVCWIVSKRVRQCLVWWWLCVCLVRWSGLISRYMNMNSCNQARTCHYAHTGYIQWAIWESKPQHCQAGSWSYHITTQKAAPSKDNWFCSSLSRTDCTRALQAWVLSAAWQCHYTTFREVQWKCSRTAEVQKAGRNSLDWSRGWWNYLSVPELDAKGLAVELGMFRHNQLTIPILVSVELCNISRTCRQRYTFYFHKWRNS